jgi:hypothetical protein
MFGRTVFGTNVRLRPKASQPVLAAHGTKNQAEFCFATLDLFLAQKIEVGVTAGSRIDDGG